MLRPRRAGRPQPRLRQVRRRDRHQAIGLLDTAAGRDAPRSGQAHHRQLASPPLNPSSFGAPRHRFTRTCALWRTIRWRRSRRCCSLPLDEDLEQQLGTALVELYRGQDALDLSQRAGGGLAKHGPPLDTANAASASTNGDVPPPATVVIIDPVPATGWAGPAASPASRSSTAVISRPRCDTALTPSAACEECAACPVNATSTTAYPRCAITRSSHVGSPTRQASGSRPARNSSTAPVPMLACSSSAPSASPMPPAVPAAAAASAAATIAATPAFMSHAPRPSSRPPSRPPVTRPANGSDMPATPTVSRWPFSSRLRP